MRGPTSTIKGRSGVFSRAQARRLPEGSWSSLDRDDILEKREERFPRCFLFLSIWLPALLRDLVCRNDTSIQLDGLWRSVVGAAWMSVYSSEAVSSEDQHIHDVIHVVTHSNKEIEKPGAKIH